MNNDLTNDRVSIYIVWLIEFELKQMKSFVKTVNQAMSEYLEKIDHGPSITDEEYLNDDEKCDEFNAWTDLVASIEGDFARRLYSSFIISWFSFFEDSLTRLGRDLGLIDEPEDEKIYLSTEKMFDLLENKQDLSINPLMKNEIDLIKEIRNMVTHNGGRFAFSVEKAEQKKKSVKVTFDDGPLYVYIKKELFDYLKLHGILKYYGTFFIKPTPEYCEHIVVLAESFFNDLFGQLNWKLITLD